MPGRGVCTAMATKRAIQCGTELGNGKMEGCIAKLKWGNGRMDERIGARDTRAVATAGTARN
eukprot:4556736-Lingulodinium_polyedra.AAC.1